MTRRAQSTTYLTTNPKIATVGPDGIVTSLRQGVAFITAQNSMVTAVLRFDAVGATQHIRLSGLVQLPDGTAAAGARIRILGSGFETTARLDGSFDLQADPLFGAVLSVVITFESGGQRYSTTMKVEPPVGLEQIDIGSLILRAVEPPAAVFPQRVFESESPISAAAADLAGDGDPDLAVANNGAGNVSVLINQTIR